MGLADITLTSVLSAIEEYDRLGEERFLEVLKERLRQVGKPGGYGPSRDYWLWYRGKKYISKAVLGAAHGYARPDLGPLGPYDGGGGKVRVQRKLESLSPEFKFSK